MRVAPAAAAAPLRNKRRDKWDECMRGPQYCKRLHYYLITPRMSKIRFLNPLVWFRRTATHDIYRCGLIADRDVRDSVSVWEMCDRLAFGDDFIRSRQTRNCQVGRVRRSGLRVAVFHYESELL